MYLRLGNLYKSGRGTNTESQKSSEESVTNAIPILEPIQEEDSFVESSFSMAFETHVSTSIPDNHPMLFNVRLVFAKTNTQDAQLFKDPMNRWVVKIEDHPTAFDPAPWVNYQGEMYVGQKGAHYQVVLEPDKVDKWGQVVTTQKPKEPPYKETLELKLLNALKAIYILVDDPNMALYKWETNKTKQCYFARNPPPHSVVKDKVLYVYLRIRPTMIVAPMFFDKHAILYEPMENKEV